MTFNNLNQINNYWNVSELNLLDKKEVILILKNISKKLMFFNVEKRIKWALKYLPQRIVLSSSFGIQSVVSLHLFTKYCSNIPIILIDTGYLFPETYRFIDELTKKMKLNLYVFRPKKSAAWQEARYGKLWEQGIEGIQRYNIINKVEPMVRALKFLKVGTWCSGLRRKQSDSRKNLLFLSIQQGVFKYFPIVDWSDYQINEYIKKNNLRYHPLQKKGYVSLGDIHTTSKWTVGMRKEDTRFFGLKRECGLHEVD